MSELLDELKELIAKHEGKDSEPVIRWIPICHNVETVITCSLFHQLGGRFLYRELPEAENGPTIQGETDLAWCQVEVTFRGRGIPPRVRILSVDT